MAEDLPKNNSVSWQTIQWLGNTIAALRRDELKLFSFWRTLKRGAIFFLCFLLALQLLVVLSFYIRPEEAAAFFGFKTVSRLPKLSMNYSSVLGEATSQNKMVTTP